MIDSANSRSGAEPDLGDVEGSVVLVGAGKMGGALLEGWLARGLRSGKLVVFEPQPSAQILARAAEGVRLNPDAAPNAQAIVVAVKPQVAPQVMQGLARWAGESAVVISIMAGRTLAFLQGALRPSAAVVRAMPNLPAAIGRGITVAAPNANVSPRQRALATRLLGATGAVEWVQDESVLNAVTAVSGSGPAYVFLLAEALTGAGEAVGLPPPLAARLARETIAGAGELLHRSPLDPATLRENVTSPGGTTAAALGVLMREGAFQRLMEEAVAAATRRSRELAE
jgi:pyrroline-5-carboxylate reductase